MTLKEAADAFHMDVDGLVVHVLRHDPPRQEKMKWADIPAPLLDSKFAEMYWGGGDTLVVSFPRVGVGHEHL